MKNLKHVVAITILASAVLFGCKKEMDDPMVAGYQEATTSFKGPGNNNPPPITDTIYIDYIAPIHSIYNSGPTNNFGWPQGNGGSKYVGEAADVTIRRKGGNIVSNSKITVTGQWSGCYSKLATGSFTTAGSYPSASVRVLGSSQLPAACTLTFVVTGVSLAGTYYDASLNVVSSVSKVYP